ncbi:MAG: putative metalloprotease with PDZ domain [Algoriphagus sp.]|jgi:predicted metalloprotease with PDZ domain
MKANYHIKSTKPTTQFIQIELSIYLASPQKLSLQLPAWRPGRYQIADYAKNIRYFSVTDTNDSLIPFEKSQKNLWEISVQNPTTILIRYDYYAAKMDAGSCWVDETQIYLNFVNCCLEVLDFPQLTYELTVEIPKDFQSMSTLPLNPDHQLIANSFQQLADSTFLAATKLTHWKYEVGLVEFHCWFKGEIHFDQTKFLEDFLKFSQRQIEDFGEFPEQEYHFIFLLLPFPHYHGVEHKRGTVITFGPAERLAESSQMEELLGVSSHELYHAWNVCRIRPSELLPYDFSKETYTRAGWMLEGITTYMGDLYLLKSGGYEPEVYLKHLSNSINRASKNLGWQNSSILESSFDLWLDGYENGIPERKVNIYAHGAVIALCLDLILLKSKQSSLPKIMREAWQEFGKPNLGYSANSFWNLILRSMENQSELDSFYKNFIAGKSNISEKLEQLLPVIGLELVQDLESNPLESKLGIVTLNDKIIKIHPKSPAYHKLMIGDEITYNLAGKSIAIQGIQLNGNVFSFIFPLGEEVYFPTYSLKLTSKMGLRKEWMC